MCPVSIGIDSDDNPHIAYIHDINFYIHCIRYDYFDGSSFKESDMNSQSLGCTGFSPDLALLPGSTRPFIVYYNDILGNLQLVHYGSLSGSGEEYWQKTEIATEGRVGTRSSIVVTSGPLIHISYYDADNNRLKHACYDGTSWNIEVIDTTGGSESAIALDSNSRPHVVYKSHDESIPTIKHAYHDGSSWKAEIIESASQGVEIGEDLSVVIDSRDHLHVSYNYGYKNGTSSEYTTSIKYACYDGSSWDIQTVGDSGTIAVGVSNDNDIAVDSTGSPHIIYYDNADYTLKYAVYSNGTWKHESPVDTITGIQTCCSITLDSQDRPHIAFLTRDNEMPWQEHLKYATTPCLSKKLYGVNSGEVQHLRYVRDNMLSKSPEGREIIKLYYKWSPAIVKVMENDEEFNEELKEMIDGVLKFTREVLE